MLYLIYHWHAVLGVKIIALPRLLLAFAPESVVAKVAAVIVKGRIMLQTIEPITTSNRSFLSSSAQQCAWCCCCFSFQVEMSL